MTHCLAFANHNQVALAAGGHARPRVAENGHLFGAVEPEPLTSPVCEADRQVEAKPEEAASQRDAAHCLLLARVEGTAMPILKLRRRKDGAKKESDTKVPEIKISFGYTYADYIEANQAHWAGRRQLYTAGCGLLFVLSVVYIWTRPHQARGYIAGVLSLGFLLLLTRFFQQSLDFVWSHNKTYRQSFEAEVTAESLLIKSHEEHARDTAIEWALVDRYTETENLFLLYQRARSFVMVPKRAFLGREQVGVRGLNEFREFVESKVEKAQASMRRATA